MTPQDGRLRLIALWRVVKYSYSTAYTLNPPFWQAKTGPDGYTKTTLDGMGRAIRVERGADSTHIQSVVDRVMRRVPVPRWVKFRRSRLPIHPARVQPTGPYTSMTGSDGRSVRHSPTAQARRLTPMQTQTTVTDPAGNWKQMTNDVQGNLLSVVEPDPGSLPGGTLTTTYTYDWMNHLTGVSMPRGSAVQTRTFVYSDAGLLTSAANPENGTVLYYYNTDNTLQYKHDAKGQDTVYTYDTQKRVTMIQRYPSGKNGTEDSCQRVTHTYDTNSVNPSFSQYSQKRLTTAQYSVCAPGRITPVTEMYSYHAAGSVTSKQLQFQRCSGTCSTVYQKADYTYDSAGRTATYGISGSLTNTSQAPPVPIVYTYGYDSMGRPATLTDNFAQWATGGQNIIWAKNGQYDFAGRMTSLQTLSAVYYPLFQTTYTTQQMTWNVNGQLTSQNWGAGGVQYVYSSTQNNGQITQAVDTLSGETIGYQYDALKRLISAERSAQRGDDAGGMEPELPVRWLRKSHREDTERHDYSHCGGCDNQQADQFAV